MSRCISILAGVVTALTLLPAAARAAHPLITEDTDTGSNAVFAIGGLIWSPLDNVDLDLGYRTSATDNARLHALLAGVTVRW